MVHLDQAILERRQVDIALFLSVQLLPQRLDPGIPLLSGLAIHSRVLLCYLGFMASPRQVAVVPGTSKQGLQGGLLRSSRVAACTCRE